MHVDHITLFGANLKFVKSGNNKANRNLRTIGNIFTVQRNSKIEIIGWVLKRFKRKRFFLVKVDYLPLK